MRNLLLPACLLLLPAGAGHAQEPVARAALAASSAWPAALPLRRDPPAAAGSASWLAASGALVLLALGGTVIVGRRRRWSWLAPHRAGQAPVLERVSSQPLTAQASLHAVRWQGEELLLACTPQQVTLLARRATPATGEPPP